MKRMIMAVLAGTAPIGLAVAQPTVPGSTPTTDTPAAAAPSGSIQPMTMPDGNFLRGAVESAQTQIVLARLAEQKGGTDTLRGYARQLDHDNTLLAQRLQVLCRTQGIQESPSLGQGTQETVNRLAPLKDAAFDQQFLQVVADIQQRDLVADQNAAKTSSNDAILAYVRDTQPMTQSHYDKGRTLRQR